MAAASDVVSHLDWALYPDAMTLLDARSQFFDRWALGPDGGYSSRWVRVEAKPMPFYFPNSRGRVQAARLHDLHHVATGYRSDWRGETAIAAWEIASGCGLYVWAWILNLGAMFIGLILFPGSVWRAFMSGRHSRNLYHSFLNDDELLPETVGWLRGMLLLDQSHGATFTDVLAFVGWSIAAVLFEAAIVLAPIAIVLWIYRAIIQ
jgi:hypothetical protein